MSTASEDVHPAARLWAALLFWPLLVIWTWLLVRPNPIPEIVEAIPGSWRFLAAKTLHGGTYAFMTVLGLIWTTSPRGRILVVALLLMHGVGTEVTQTFVPNRSGEVRDVLVDWTGVLIATMVMRFSVRYRRTQRPVLATVNGG